MLHAQVWVNKGVVSVLTLVENDSWLCVVTRNERERAQPCQCFVLSLPVICCSYYDHTAPLLSLLLPPAAVCSILHNAAPVLVCSVLFSLLITNLFSLLQQCSVSAPAVESSSAAFPGCQAPWSRVCRGCLSISSVSSGCRGSGDLCQPPLLT